MLKLARPEITPPGGYKYRDPDLGVDFDEGLMISLVTAVTRMRAANGLPVSGDLAVVIEDAICRRLPAALVRHVKPGGEGRPSPAVNAISPLPSNGKGNVRPVSEGQALAATTGLLRRCTRMVSWDQALPRASICRRCTLNRAEPGCYSCKYESVFSPKVGFRRHALNSDANFAGVCVADSTFTKASLRCDDGFTGTYPEICWKNGDTDAQH